MAHSDEDAHPRRPCAPSVLDFQATGIAPSSTAETDEQRTVVKRNSYAPFGEVFAPTVIDGTGYTGHVMDQVTGLTYMQARYYDPQIGRFLSTDPAAAGFNLYNYANNNPYHFTDPDGRMADVAGGCDSGVGGCSQGSFGVGSSDATGSSGDFASTLEEGPPPSPQSQFQLATDKSSRDPGDDEKNGFPSIEQMVENALPYLAGVSAQDMQGAKVRVDSFLDASGKGLKCALACGAKNFIGEDLIDVMINAHEQTFVRAFEKGFQEGGVRVGSHVAGAVGAALTLRDSAGSVMCAAKECL